MKDVTVVQKQADHHTQIITEPQLRRLIVFRRQIEAVSARILADCDRMLRHVMQPDRAAWRTAIGEALLAARHVVSLAQLPLPTDAGQAEKQLAELETSVRASLDQVVAAMATLMRFVPVTLDDELLISDARTVSGAASSAISTASGQFVAVGAPKKMTPSGGVSAQRTSARILVVDDDPDLRDMLERMLTRLGFEVIVTTNGREALETAAGTPVDLVLTDMNMPEMDGIALLKALKESPDLRDIPVVVVSSEGDLTTVVRSIELGAEDHIQKPFQATLLQARVRASLVRKRLRDLELDYLKRVGELTAAAEAVDRDMYVPGSLNSVARTGDELGNLARVFERVMLNMKSKEERLTNRLNRLRIEMGLIAPSGAVVTKAGDESPFGTGQLIAGRYKVIGRLGKGGMGMVYHATDVELKEDVAIKVVRADVIEKDPSMINRFKSEIKLARKLSHLNILRTHDLGEFDGTYYITMEYVRGLTLSEVLDVRGRLSVDGVLAVGTQLADALAVAHAEKIIHRDIKPANLLMDEKGTLKVMDFGLAKVVASDTGNTQGGYVVGTPRYMAPEQLMNGQLDGRADLWAVGVVLYECLSGRTPFDTDAPVVIASKMIDKDFPAIGTLLPHIPERLEAIIGNLLQLHVDDRIQTAGELSRQLAEIEAPPPG